MASSSSLLNFLSPLFPSSKNTPQHPPIITPSSSIPNPKPNSPSSPSSSSPQPLSISTSKQQNGLMGPIISSKEECPSSDLMAVVCPSLAYSNTLFFRSAYNVQVVVDENEPEERLLNRFRREVMRAGVIQECKRRRFFENKQDKEKRKSREAAKRNSRRRRPRGPFQNKEETTKVEKKDDDEDNWEMPDGDSPL